MEKTKSKLNRVIIILCIVIVVLLSTGIYIVNLAFDIAYIAVQHFIDVIELSEKLLIVNVLRGDELTDAENDKYSEYLDSKYSIRNEVQENNEIDFWKTLESLRQEAKEATR